VKSELAFLDDRQLLQPVFELFRSMSGAIVNDHVDLSYLTVQSLWNDNLLEKGLEIDKAFARATSSIDSPISDTEPAKEVACSTTVVA
jgi:hypothetical protein